MNEPGLSALSCPRPSPPVRRALHRELCRPHTEQTVGGWRSMDDMQGGDPAKVGDAVAQVIALRCHPRRFTANASPVNVRICRDRCARADVWIT